MELKKIQTQITSQNWPAVLRDLPVNSSTDINSVAKVKGTQIQDIASENKEIGRAVFNLTLRNLTGFFGDKWDEERCNEIGNTLYSNYYYWTFLELKLFIEQFKAGKFGKMYGKLNTPYIMEAALTFDAILAEAREGAYGQYTPPKEDPNAVYITKERMSEILSQVLKEPDYSEPEIKPVQVNTNQKKWLLKELESPDFLQKFKKQCEVQGQDFNEVMELLKS